MPVCEHIVRNSFGRLVEVGAIRDFGMTVIRDIIDIIDIVSANERSGTLPGCKLVVVRSFEARTAFGDLDRLSGHIQRSQF